MTVAAPARARRQSGRAGAERSGPARRREARHAAFGRAPVRAEQRSGGAGALRRARRRLRRRVDAVHRRHAGGARARRSRDRARRARARSARSAPSGGRAFSCRIRTRPAITRATTPTRSCSEGARDPHRGQARDAGHRLAKAHRRAARAIARLLVEDGRGCARRRPPRRRARRSPATCSSSPDFPCRRDVVAASASEPNVAAKTLPVNPTPDGVPLLSRGGCLMFRGRVRHVHFIGVGGIGMSGLAEILRTLEFDVSGSDLREGENTRSSRAARACASTSGTAPRTCRARTWSSTRAPSTPTTRRSRGARARHSGDQPRAEMLAELMRVKYGIAIAGSHGKTTTTSLVATVLRAAGFDPTVVVGGRMAALGSNARLGAGDLLVAEADESDGSFLRLTPTIAVVTNIDPEHLDFYGTHEKLKDAFVEFVEKVPFYGLAVLCLDHPHVQESAAARAAPARDLRPLAAGRLLARATSVPTGSPRRFVAYRRGEPLGEFERARCRAATTCSTRWRRSRWPTSSRCRSTSRKQALATFHGVARRFTIVARGRAASRWSTTTATTRPRSRRRSRPLASAYAGARHRGVPAAPLHAHRAPVRRVHARLQRRRRRLLDRHLRGRRKADPGHHQPSSSRRPSPSTATTPCSYVADRAALADADCAHGRARRRRHRARRRGHQQDPPRRCRRHARSGRQGSRSVKVPRPSVHGRAVSAPSELFDVSDSPTPAGVVTNRQRVNEPRPKSRPRATRVSSRSSRPGFVCSPGSPSSSARRPPSPGASTATR